VHAKAEPGIFDVAELAPTVQCVPENYADSPPASRPPFLDAVLDADPGRIKFDTIQSEEGGRFFHTRTRHVIVETDELHDHPDFRWMTPHQLTTLLQHSHYVNIQCRSLLACLRALASSTEGDA
jgi:oxidase EvaA